MVNLLSPLLICVSPHLSPLLSSHHLTHLLHSPSLIYTLHSPHLTSLIFTQLGAETSEAAALQLAWPWQRGLSALTHSVAAGHLHHELEPLVHFMRLTELLGEMSSSSRTS